MSRCYEIVVIMYALIAPVFVVRIILVFEVWRGMSFVCFVSVITIAIIVRLWFFTCVPVRAVYVNSSIFLVCDCAKAQHGRR